MFNGLLLPPNQPEARGDAFENCAVFGLMSACGLEAYPIDWPATRTEIQNLRQNAVTTQKACLSTIEFADAGLLDLWLAGIASLIRQFTSHAFFRTLPLQTIGFAKDNNLPAGRQQKFYTALRPRVIACPASEAARNSG